MNIDEIINEESVEETTAEEVTDTTEASPAVEGPAAEISTDTVPEEPDPKVPPHTVESVTPIIEAVPVAPTVTIDNESAPAKNGHYAPIKTWGFFGIHWLLRIPLIGPLFVIIWACGGCRKYQKRYYARSLILFAVIDCILMTILAIIAAVLFADWIISNLDAFRAAIQNLF